MRYDDAVASLYQVPVEQFIAERKRLAGELKAAGDKDGAAKLAKLARPPISAWVVDQLWWRARDAFEALFETAEQLRNGKLDAMAAHRDAVAKLRAQAIQILTEAEHGATESTLRRVTQTLSALAAAGSWDPDPPGALSADRDPPGFEALGVANIVELPTSRAAAKPARHEAKPDDELARKRREAREEVEAARRREREVAAARAEAAAEMRRAETERARAAAERHRIEAALRTAHGDVTTREREVVKLERDLASARNLVEQAKAVVNDLEDRLAQLHN